MSRRPTRLTRAQLLAAEIYGYSFQNYEDHLGIGNVRYEELMPQTAELLERALREAWPPSKVAAAVEIPEEDVADWVGACERAVAVIDAENPAESFRNAVRFTIDGAVSEGLSIESGLDELVTQICFRTADLAYLLDLRNEKLSRYSRHLRKEPNVGYYAGYFDEDEEES